MLVQRDSQSGTIDVPPCEYCKQTVGHRAFCPATEEERETEKRFGDIRENVAECGLHARYVRNERSLDTFIVSAHSSLRKALEGARAWVRNEPPPWIYMFSSEPGLGKTHLAASALAARIRAGRYGRYVKFTAMQLDIVSAPFEEKVQRFRKYARTPILVLDEIGAEKTSEFNMTLMFDVIDERYEHDLPTWLNSNLSLGELAEKYAPTDDSRAAKKLISRIYEKTGGKSGGGRFQLEGKSYRNR